MSIKCGSSAGTGISMSVADGSFKIKVLTLVVNTANLINERATPNMGMAHALIAPVAIMLTYFVLTVFVMGAIKKKTPSLFLQIYGQVMCCLVQIYLSLTVFIELKSVSEKHPALALNGVLPMINSVLMIVDLTVIIFSNRTAIGPPLSLQTPRSSTLEIQSNN
ncbi:unnamed protein product [Leptidea sinapis]|uniref:Uncharacterized protein n=1 Tax=Leptidea sinapis TaxID=189913 RepID=A0A5E4QEL7_9NEOP|nr:unnamed protein product [Leptidea sinapis]